MYGGKKKTSLANQQGASPSPVQSIDSYMNIQLSNTEEYIDRKCTGTLGQILIRFVFLFFLSIFLF